MGWIRWTGVLALLAVAAPAQALGPGDGVYGRYDHPFTLALGVGGGVSMVGGQAAGTFVGEARLRHLDVGGPFVSVSHGPGAGGHVVAGVEIRPLFPLLFLRNAFTGHEVPDLILQSLGVELGVAVAPLDGDVGAGFAVGVGMEVPLVPPSRWGQGVWLRLAARHVRAATGFQRGPDRSAGEWTAFATLGIKLGVGGGATVRDPPWRTGVQRGGLL
jgi:hypothetical protein